MFALPRAWIAGLAPWLLLWGSPAAASAPLAAPSSGLPAFVIDGGRLTAPEIRAVDHGRIVAKVIDTSDHSEVLSFAVSRVETTPGRVLSRFRDVEQWRQDPWVLQVGRLGASPSIHDLDGLTLDPSDVKNLSRCQLHKCDLRLPADAIARFRSVIDWSSPNRSEKATDMFRDTLASYAGSYLARGNEALFKYENNDDPVPIADGLHRILTRSAYLGEAAPDLYTYLDAFPKDRPEDACDYLYWLKEKFWITNVVSLNHATVVDRPTRSGRLIIQVSKQLYATRYYEAMVSLTAYIEGPAGESYLVNLNRARADIRPGGFNWIERLLLNRLVRNRVESQLAYFKQRLEAS